MSQRPPKASMTKWTDFEAGLIKFVETHSILYDLPKEDEDLLRRKYIVEDLWNNFSKKWNYPGMYGRIYIGCRKRGLRDFEQKRIFSSVLLCIVTSHFLRFPITATILAASRTAIKHGDYGTYVSSTLLQQKLEFWRKLLVLQWPLGTRFVSVCRNRWRQIKRQFAEISTSEIPRRSPGFYKYMDGSLDFYIPIVQEQTKRKITKNSSLKSNESNTETANFLKEFNICHETFKYNDELEGNEVEMIEKEKNNFNALEKALIQYAKAHPVIYDTRINEHMMGKSREKKVRKLWEKFASKYNLSDESCHKSWMRLKKHYLYVCLLRDNEDKFPTFSNLLKNPAFIKYLEKRLTFLEPFYSYLKERKTEKKERPSVKKKDSNLTEKEKRRQFRHELKEIYTQRNPEENLNSHKLSFNEKELTLISFVEEEPLLYDVSYIKIYGVQGNYMKTLQKIWEEMAEKLNTTPEDCFNQWEMIRQNYAKFRKDQALSLALGLTGDEQIIQKYKVLSFLAPFYNFDHLIDNPHVPDSTVDFGHSISASCTSQVVCTESKYCEPQPSTSAGFGQCSSENIETLTVFVSDDDSEMDEDDDKKEIEPIQLEHNNIQITVNNLETDVINHIFGVKDGDEPQVKTTGKLEKPELQLAQASDSQNLQVFLTNAEKKISQFFYEVKDKEDNKPQAMTEAEAVISLVHNKLSTLDFFKEIGKYVAKRFPEKNQKVIRLKSWSLVTKMELDMLQNEK